MHELLPLLILAIAIATILNVLLKRVGIPTVIGYILTGAALGPVVGEKALHSEELEHIAEFGVVFLMFTIGLEFSVAHLKEMRREVLRFGGAQVVVTGVLMALIAWGVFGIDGRAASVLGGGLALSSTAIVLKLLNEAGQMKSEYGRSAVGILVFQDIAVIPILLMVTVFTSQEGGMGELLLETGRNAVIVLAMLLLVGRRLLRLFFEAVAGANSKEIFMGAIFVVVIGASWLTHAFGFPYSLGAFLAGHLIADSIHRYQVEADLIPFRDLLLGVFFVTVGFRIEHGFIADSGHWILLLAAGMMLFKAACIFLLLTRSVGKEVSLKTALSLAQVGEFSLVVLSLLIGHGMLDDEVSQLLVAAVVVSMIATPFLIQRSDTIIRAVTRGAVGSKADEVDERLGDHVVLCGYGAFGRAVAKRLEAAGIRHVVVAASTADFVAARGDAQAAVFGDPSDRILLERLAVRKAMGVVLALDDSSTVARTTAALEQIDPKIKVIARVSSEEELKDMDGANNQLLLDGNSQVAESLVEQISQSRRLAEQTSALRYLHEIEASGDPERSIDLIRLEQGRLLQIHSDLFERYREGNDVMSIKALHSSFQALGMIISDALDRLTTAGSLSPEQYERIGLLQDNERRLEAMNSELERLGFELKKLEQDDRTRTLAGVVVEALDAILHSLRELAEEPNETDFALLRAMTSADNSGLARIRERYLGETGLDTDLKRQLLSVTSHVDRLRALFGAVGHNYRGLVREETAT
ncbi:MAG: cation:proton antiporter domain-containing protein [Planctomycetota bacterium]|jgi:CPA2 family monovalent cation:H+ antiporter-2